MAILTVGFNTTAQADAILGPLRTELAAVVAGASITRARVWLLPDLPFVALLGPNMQPRASGLATIEYRLQWTLLLARAVQMQGGVRERRADVLDTWADAAMGVVLDTFASGALEADWPEDAPHRVEDENLAQLVERLGEPCDATALVFHTRCQVTPPQC